MKKLISSRLIASVGLLAISMGLVGIETYLISSTLDTVTTTEKAIADKRVDLAKETALRNATQDLVTSEDVVSSHLLKKERIVGFLSSFEAAGSPVSASGRVVSVSEDRNATHPKVSVSMLITGSFDSVMRAVGILENSPYDSELMSLTLDLGGATSKGVEQWSAAAVFSVGLQRQGTTTAKKP